jgi:type III secretory pathway component EscS
MTPESIANLAHDALLLAITMSAPLVGVAALVGLALGLLQALTQLQDQTTSFAIKLAVTLGLLLVLLPWLGSLAGAFGDRVFTLLAQVR